MKINMKINKLNFIVNNLNEFGLIILMLFLYIVFGLTTNGFLSVNNQQNILRDASMLAIVAFGATFIIIAGEIDVSVGPMVAFLSVMFSFFMKWQFPLSLSVPLVIALGLFLGSIAGLLRALFGVPSFVATLGLWSILRGLALFVTNALPVSFSENKILNFLDGDFIFLPISAWIMSLFFIIFWFLSRKTIFGRSIYAIGGNMNAAIMVGLPVKKLQIMLFATAGFLAAVAALLLTSRLGSGNAGAATGLEFDVIAAVVIGGTALSGGKGTMMGTFLGVFVITAIGNGLVLLGLNPFFQEVVRGLIIVLAVLLNLLAARNKFLAKN